MIHRNDQRRRVLITGASRGIGAVIARRLYEQGDQIIPTARKAVDLQRYERWESNSPERCQAMLLDLLNPESIDTLSETLLARSPTLDVIIHNAGIAPSAPFLKTKDGDWSRAMQVNLFGPQRLTRNLLPTLLKSNAGRVVFIASVAGLTGFAYTTAYCATKHAQVGLMRALATEYAKSPVTFNAICPGFVETDMTRAAVNAIQEKTGRGAEEARGALEAFNPQGRLIQAEEVAHLVESLISGEALGINGQAFALDGGQVMR